MQILVSRRLEIERSELKFQAFQLAKTFNNGYYFVLVHLNSKA